MTSICLPEADPLKTRCPVCFAHRGEPCIGGEGKSHSAREALRIAEIETGLGQPTSLTLSPEYRRM